MRPSPALSRSPRRPTGALARGGALAVLVSLLPGLAGAQPVERSQSVASLQERAKKVAAELDQLDQRTNDLDEQFNDASLQLDTLKKKLADNQSQVDASQTQLNANRAAAQQYLVQAYVGSAGNDGGISGLTDDAATASQRETYLAVRFGDSQDVVDGLVAAQKDLADQESALKSANAAVDAKLAQIKASKSQLESTIADRQKLADSINGDLKAAVEAEQQRRAAAAEAKARAEAQAAAARAAAARRSPAVVGRTTTGTSSGSGSTSTSPQTDVVSVPAAPAASPPPANAPTAVRVALEQQGDPYVWAAAGPNSFDCSGLVMYAYAAAGVSLPHSSRALRAMARSISADELQPGDLVFGGSPVHHVGIYIGNGQMVHAPHSGDVVKVSSMYGTSKPVSFGRL